MQSQTPCFISLVAYAPYMCAFYTCTYIALVIIYIYARARKLYIMVSLLGVNPKHNKYVYTYVCMYVGLYLFALYEGPPLLITDVV